MNLPSPAEQFGKPAQAMKRSAPVYERPDFIVRAAPFTIRTFHAPDERRLMIREHVSFEGGRHSTPDKLITIPMPYLAFPKKADATIADFDRTFT